MQVIQANNHAYSHSHRQLSVDVSCNMPVHVPQAQAAHELIPVDEQAESVAMKTCFLNSYTKNEIHFFVGQSFDGKQLLCNI